MPTYNAGKFLADSINSILQQSYKNLELLITDDASTDAETIRILNDLRKKTLVSIFFFLKKTLVQGMHATSQSQEPKVDI